MSLYLAEIIFYIKGCNISFAFLSIKIPSSILLYGFSKTSSGIFEISLLLLYVDCGAPCKYSGF